MLPRSATSQRSRRSKPSIFQHHLTLRQLDSIVKLVNQPVQVEVSIQDFFFESESASESPISVETWQDWFSRWLEHLQPALAATGAYELCLRLTNDAEIQTLNAQYRHKDQPTDVLAFAALEVETPLFDHQVEMPLYLGDIVISVETARSQAQQEGHSLQQELAWLSAHGLLHLLGWDHPDDSSLIAMLSMQETLLQSVGLGTQYLAEKA
jgi:probable rRNA maturation factor